VLDWKKKESSRAGVRVAIRSVLDEGLPDAYGPEIFDDKRHQIYELLYSNYGNDGQSVYDDSEALAPRPTLTMPKTVEEVNDRHIHRAQVDLAWHVKISELAFGEAMSAWDASVPELISNDGNRAVEFKQTARWNVREQKKDKLMEDIVAKTVAGFANTNGGTLLVGVHDDKYPVGLEHDLALVKPPTPDGYVNWMDTMLENRFGFIFVKIVTISTEQVDGHDVCRINVPRAAEPMWSTFKDTEKLFVRRNNSTREVPADEIDSFIAERFGPDQATAGEET